MKIELNETSINLLKYFKKTGNYKSLDQTLEAIAHTMICYLYNFYWNSNKNEKKEINKIIRDIEKIIKWKRP